MAAAGGCLVETPPDGYCCRRYASYWNAFLFVAKFCIDLCKNFESLSTSISNKTLCFQKLSDLFLLY